MTDTAGNVSQFVWYASYGESLVDEHTTTYENPFKFSGKELDDITGLYDYGARNRNPITAVWYGIDELFEKSPENGPYGYCGGNPVRYFDQDGRVIRVDKKYQSQFNSVLRQVFKDYASRFSFDENGILQYEGSTKGMTQDQTELAKGIKKVMEQNEVTNLFMNLLMTYLLKVERQHLLAHPPELVQFIYLPIKMKIWKKITSSLIRIFQVRYQ